MRYRKATLCVIIVLLVFFLPITIFSTTKAVQKALYVENPNHDFKLNNKLYFYDGEELLGTYPCVNFPDVCELASPDNKKDTGIILKEYETEYNIELPVINNRYVFIKDTIIDNITSAGVILYDLKENQLLAKYDKVKNYGVGLDNDLYIIKNSNNQYGVIELKNGIVLRIPFEYDYIGVTKIVNHETSKISSSKFVVLKDNVWQILDDYGSVLSADFNDPIFIYNDTYVITEKSDKQMVLTNYNGDLILANSYNYLDFYEQYLLVIDNLNNFYVYNLQTSQKMTNSYFVKDINDVTFTKKEANIQISINNKVVETIPI